MFSLKEKLEEVEIATIRSGWKRPDTEVIESSGWYQTITPSSKQFWFNTVSKSELTSENAEAQVKQVLDHYRALGNDCRWVVQPTSTPKNLPAILENEGMSLWTIAYGMVAEVETLRLDLPKEVKVERVTFETAEDYVRIASLGWNTPAEVASEILKDMKRILKDPNPETLYYLAKHNGELAGSGALLPFERSGYLLGSSVALQFRGKGVYRALVAERAKDLRAMGIPLITIQAMATSSAPICEKLGFKKVSELKVYTLKSS